MDGEKEYEVDKILESKIYGRKLKYLVSFKGYGPEDNEWLFAEDVHADQLVEEFHRRNPRAPRHYSPLVAQDRMYQNYEGLLTRQRSRRDAGS